MKVIRSNRSKLSDGSNRFEQLERFELKLCLAYSLAYTLSPIVIGDINNAD